MESKIWKAKCYLRLSKDKSDRSGAWESDSIANQRALIYEFIKGKPDIEICGERCDDGYSGVSFDRPGFNALMNDIRDKSIDCVIVKDLSRFGRNHIEAGNYIENLFPLIGVRFIAVNDGIDTINPKTASDNIIIPFKNLINDAYCRDISIKVRSQLELKCKQGQFIGSFTSYGYQKSAKDKNKLVIDANVADFVREIFRLKLSGMSAESISRRFNEMGIPSPMEYKKSIGQNYVSTFKTGMKAKWSATAILRILKNRVYVGTLVQGREGTPNNKIHKKKVKPESEWIVVENCHEPIISMETFKNVQRSLLLDTRTSPNKETVCLFSGILLCADCGCTMIRKSVPYGSKKYIYQVCSGNVKKNGCTPHRIREDYLTATVLAAIQMRIEETLSIEEALLCIDTSELSKIRVKSLTQQLQQKQLEIEKYQCFKKGLYETYIEGTVSRADYDMFYLEYEKQQEEFCLQAQMIQNELDSTLDNKDEYAAWMEGFKQHRNITELNRAIVVSLIENILIYGRDRIEIKFRYQDEYDRIVSDIAEQEVI